jgi:hypothetical protein
VGGVGWGAVRDRVVGFGGILSRHTSFYNHLGRKINIVMV